MTVATQKRMTLNEFLDYNDGTDISYELVDGVLVAMGAESDTNVEIAMVLMAALLQFVRPEHLRRGTEIVVPLRARSRAETRYPDLMVITEATRLALKAQGKRSIILTDMPAPLLVIEVVSPGNEDSENYKRDYEYKPEEYAALGIPEYWLVDPDRAVILIGTLKDGVYEFVGFRGDAPIGSPTFPDLDMTAAQVLRAGR